MAEPRRRALRSLRELRDARRPAPADPSGARWRSPRELVGPTCRVRRRPGEPGRGNRAGRAPRRAVPGARGHVSTGARAVQPVRLPASARPVLVCLLEGGRSRAETLHRAPLSDRRPEGPQQANGARERLDGARRRQPFGSVGGGGLERCRSDAKPDAMSPHAQQPKHQAKPHTKTTTNNVRRFVELRAKLICAMGAISTPTRDRTLSFCYGSAHEAELTGCSDRIAGHVGKSAELLRARPTDQRLQLDPESKRTEHITRSIRVHAAATFALASRRPNVLDGRGRFASVLVAGHLVRSAFCCSNSSRVTTPSNFSNSPRNFAGSICPRASCPST